MKFSGLVVIRLNKEVAIGLLTTYFNMLVQPTYIYVVFYCVCIFLHAITHFAKLQTGKASDIE